MPLFSFLAPAVRVGLLPPTMHAFHVGTCEFSAVPEKLLRRFAEYGVPARFGKTTAEPAEPAYVVLPTGATLALVTVAGGDDRLLARDILYEAYGFLAVSCRQVPVVAADAYARLGGILGFDSMFSSVSPIDLVEIEPALRHSGFFKIEDELFRVHGRDEMGVRLKSALRQVGLALHNFASDAEPPALTRAIEALLRPADRHATDRVVDAALQSALGWGGWLDLRDRIENEPNRVTEVAIELRDVVGRLLEQALAAGDYANDYAGMLARLHVLQ